MDSFVCRHLKIIKEGKTFVDIDFSIDRALALVGESGSGKSLTLKALLGMLPQGFEAKIAIESSFALERGKTIAYVPQNPFTALSPLTKIIDQWIVGTKQAEKMVMHVGLDLGLLKRFPAELSGGQLQRMVIAMALAAKPKLLLLDEPTTALDASLRGVIVDLLLALQKELGFLMLFVTHDIATAAALCSQIVVIQKGRVVEKGMVHKVLHAPMSAYTKALIEANFAHRKFRQ